ncbi:helix-turn-helix transcriptional regulator [Candidatus Methylopumilus universalis]|uniref:Helix-turn-helix transcriptional regulator n=1 Tax=Candidatus Methylopumilus universalis TaxID=2588536 RepID=A0AAX1EZJ4_9PROT|nr:helix-turn-helix transcriptional regulator [Candidatus Methylopumilus universalis]QDC40941.1 helix-turn-helix transcriptional regulator [Candidatus Methylopumilus universalis]QDC42232.1 helix-turn-helix transcriptional regulator [Candidatus Methylopumilus universalis]QDC54618.1 helix-turn-helix transcriptional regulator [Candidatus Methylopumilus universalis]QDC55898.1 helix-turn-helix transcriptional regulator [Candidatus Methylopumilus universalis]QDC57181.1 helix-turn-helix transcription
MILLAKLDGAFGKTLKSRRCSSNLSQEQLGLKSGLSRPYISELEMGKKDPSLFTIFKLSDALKVKPSFFIEEIEQVISIS